MAAIPERHIHHAAQRAINVGHPYRQRWRSACAGYGLFADFIGNLVWNVSGVEQRKPNY